MIGWNESVDETFRQQLISMYCIETHGTLPLVMDQEELDRLKRERQRMNNLKKKKNKKVRKTAVQLQCEDNPTL